MKLNKKGFTLAEVLITLAIIGIIAAILFPSILANYTERTLKAKRQALFGRMSQAMGEMTDQFNNYEDVSCTDIADPRTCTDQGSALKFINEGFSKFYKISAVCDVDTLAACDIPEEVTLEDGSTLALREMGSSLFTYTNDELNEPANIVVPYDLKTAAFMTKNGESILLFYNPRCNGKSQYQDRWVGVGNLMCVNMVFDLNGGKQKPNKFGEDIGFMTSFYPDSPFLVMPRPYDWRAIPDYEGTTDSSGNEYISDRTNLHQNFQTAKGSCESLGDNVGLPSYEEAMSMVINRELWAPIEQQRTPYNTNLSLGGAWMWTSTMADPTHAWRIWLADKKKQSIIHTYLCDTSYSGAAIARCVYKD